MLLAQAEATREFLKAPATPLGFPVGETIAIAGVLEDVEDIVDDTAFERPTRSRLSRVTGPVVGSPFELDEQRLIGTDIRSAVMLSSPVEVASVSKLSRLVRSSARVLGVQDEIGNCPSEACSEARCRSILIILPVVILEDFSELDESMRAKTSAGPCSLSTVDFPPSARRVDATRLDDGPTVQVADLQVVVVSFPSSFRLSFKDEETSSGTFECRLVECDDEEARGGNWTLSCSRLFSLLFRR